MSITLTTKQSEGLRCAVERFKLGEKFTVISGYAGTGKSTLVRFIIDALGVDPEEEVAYCAFTGKAATVLQSKGCPNAVTAHKLLFKAKPMPNGSYKFYPKSSAEIPYQVIVVDEVSMLPVQLWQQLLRHPVYVLATGDPEQLPSINSDDDNHVLDHPHVFLDEIMRQALDSEIIRASMWIREGKPLAQYPCSNEQVMVVDKNEVVSGMYEWADQIICATNAKRQEINDFVRAQRGFGEEPELGDKITSLRNHWDWASSSGEWALTNGTIGTIENIQREDIWVPKYVYESRRVPIMYTSIGIEGDDSFEMLPIDYNSIKTGKGTLSPKEIYLMNKCKTCPDAPFEFNYAYAITCHRAQGSSWPNVLVFEERFPFSEEDHRRWLYTAITRSEQRAVIVKK